MLNDLVISVFFSNAIKTLVPWQAGLLPGLPIFSAFSCLELGGAECHYYCGKIQITRW